MGATKLFPRFQSLVFPYVALPEVRLRPAAPFKAPVTLDRHWDGSVFCVAKGNPKAPDNPQDGAFVAVKTYLEAHPQERYRPRRYLMVQALRAAYPCPPG